GLQAATINRRLAALRSLTHLARTFGLMPWKLEVQNVRAEAYRDTRGPGKHGFRCLLEEVGRKKTKKTIRDKAILRLLYDLALRCGEVVALDLEDIDLNASTMAVRGKGRSSKQLLTFPEPTKAALKDWKEAR